MDGKLLARLGAVVFVAVAITATAIEMTRKEEQAPVQASRPSEDMPADPLRDAQRRCQLLGEAAARDAECLRTWAETRDRFLGVTPAPAPMSPQHDDGR
ncbi:putative entry exclusion protein TrbK-alt [Bradyrhizobium viridifuturi]|jgi:conjugative transfer region protein TrbK|nr:putative entry exclusion protein TrbK-alt [Bradyrhizobium viridifuturi]MBR1048596.1 putative entry exclusion protein TrbK-alt [Bradyrhizobium viridifuturi]MBR1083699.1 putative entry exclusion protein TrbK-alt [Bradyrhizobium viridifuturi]MBR1099163.1 putative entry exclusion protein TrbK-alt [Bradyrhizobium viridifuturi]MBR1106319.1 putative entry exclusion protein TrbK-alt [Bradyrhizobium viridifuturi]